MINCQNIVFVKTPKELPNHTKYSTVPHKDRDVLVCGCNSTKIEINIVVQTRAGQYLDLVELYVSWLLSSFFFPLSSFLFLYQCFCFLIQTEINEPVTLSNDCLDKEKQHNDITIWDHVLLGWLLMYVSRSLNSCLFSRILDLDWWTTWSISLKKSELDFPLSKI